MTKATVPVVLLCASLLCTTGMLAQEDKQKSTDPCTRSVNEVVQWNKILLTIVRTPGAQPATVHPTRSFAMMHAAIYDAVNSIDRRHSPYLLQVADVSKHASQAAAAAAAGHEVLLTLYPNFKTVLDADLQQSLANIGTGKEVSEGLRVGQEVGDRIVALRSSDGCDALPVHSFLELRPETTSRRLQIFLNSRNLQPGR